LVEIPPRLRPFIGGAYFVAGGGFMLWVAIFGLPEEPLVDAILLVSGIALFVLGLLEITTASRSSRR
jgi:hypothetical protein